MTATPAPMLAQLYTVGSLANGPDGVRFGIKNRLFDATLVGVHRVTVDGVDVPLDSVQLSTDGTSVAASSVSASSAFPFALRQEVEVVLAGHAALTQGSHELGCAFVAEPFGELDFTVSD